ncbi:MAG TPA: hypothetical protein VFL49_05720 [Pseudolabrys sp.]|nr:hypothetical protein [Pseudolabrys sp.]
MRMTILPIALAALAGPAVAEPREVFGYGGELGEWEVSATVTEKESSPSRELSGPLTMTHIGICTQDGPEQKMGEIRFLVLDAPPRLRASLLVDGVSCTYSGKLSNFYSGTLNCPGRAGVPLKLWLK